MWRVLGEQAEVSKTRVQLLWEQLASAVEMESNKLKTTRTAERDDPLACA